MSRLINDKHPAGVEPLQVDKPIIDFLTSHAKDYTFLLAHALDGVFWGRVEQDQIKTRVAGSLNAGTLLEARLFGVRAELLVWKDGNNRWQARKIGDAPAKDATFKESYDESQMLWGTHTGKEDNGFVEMIDGAQGMVHWAPVIKGLSAGQPEAELSKRLLQLQVRHYLGEDKDTGALRVVASRLIDLKCSVEGVK